LEAACAVFCAQVNARPHRVTRRPPVELLAEEQARLHPLPAAPYTLAFGATRTVGVQSPMVTFDHAQYWVPHTLAGQVVWVRAHGEQIIVVHVGPHGPVEVARHARTSPGRPRVEAAHFPPQPEGPLARTPRPRTPDEAAFLALGDGAALWLTEAAAAGTSRIRAKMAHAVALAKLGDPAKVNWALGHAAVSGRFAEADLAAILAHQHTIRAGASHQAGEDASLAKGPPAGPGSTRARRHPPKRVRAGEPGRHPAPPPLDAGLEALLRRMRLPHIRRVAPEVLATAKAQRWEPAEVLRVLLAEEVAGRDRSALATRRAHAGFPTGKTFDAWDETASSIPAPTQQALRTLEWVGRRENLVVCGPSGTGKTFLLEALGQTAVQAGMRVAWFTLEALGVLVRCHRADDTVTKAVARILRADLIVVDDIGLLPVSPDAAEGLYRLVDAAYEKRSVAVSSNLHPAGFDELMPKTLTTATVDRLLHHAHLCQTSGESVRLAPATTGARAVPLRRQP